MSELINCINNLSAKDIIKSIAKTSNGTPFYLNTVGSGAGFCVTYQVVYDSLTTKPSAAIATAQNTMCCVLVDAGIWAKLDVFYLFAQTTNGAGEALINWKLPGSFDATAFNAPAFVALEGFTGDGASAYIDCNWNPATNGINYTLNDGMIGLYSRTNLAESNQDAGVIVGGDLIQIRLRSATDAAAWAVNDDGTEGVAGETDSRGLYIIQRTGVNAREGIRNLAAWGIDVRAVSGIPSGNMYVLARNNGGDEEWSGKQISFFFAGASLSAGERTNLQNAIETYMYSNGKGVIP